MRNSLELLEDVVDTQALQIIQDDLAAVTDMAVLTVDAGGKPVTRHSKCTDFCRAMRSATQSSRLCESCDYRGDMPHRVCSAPMSINAIWGLWIWRYRW